MCRKVMGCQTVEGAVRSTVVVDLLPVTDDGLGFMHTPELLSGQTFIAQATVEAFHVAVLPGTARLEI